MGWHGWPWHVHIPSFAWRRSPVVQAQAILKALPSLVDVDVPQGSHITLCGEAASHCTGL
jgi:hypothetical protein